MLSDTRIRSAKPAEKPIRLSDEKGLYLEVSPSGGKWWRLKYRFAGKEKLLSMGTYPDTGLKLRGPLPGPEPTKRGGPPKMPVEAWARIAAALGASPTSGDQELARAVKAYIDRMPAAIAFVRTLPAPRQHQQAGIERTRQVVERTRPGPEMER